MLVYLCALQILVLDLDH